MLRAARHKIALGAIGFAVLLGSARSAEAGSWIFRPSYFTHEVPIDAPRNFGPVPPMRQDRSGPYTTRPAGAYVRSGWRQVRSYQWIGGGYDNLNYFESFIQFGEQF